MSQTLPSRQAARTFGLGTTIATLSIVLITGCTKVVSVTADVGGLPDLGVDDRGVQIVIDGGVPQPDAEPAADAVAYPDAAPPNALVQVSGKVVELGSY